MVVSTGASREGSRNSSLIVCRTAVEECYKTARMNKDRGMVVHETLARAWERCALVRTGHSSHMPAHMNVAEEVHTHVRIGSRRNLIVHVTGAEERDSVARTTEGRSIVVRNTAAQQVRMNVDANSDECVLVHATVAEGRTTHRSSMTDLRPNQIWRLLQ